MKIPQSELLSCWQHLTALNVGGPFFEELTSGPSFAANCLATDKFVTPCIMQQTHQFTSIGNGRGSWVGALIGESWTAPPNRNGGTAANRLRTQAMTSGIHQQLLSGLCCCSQEPQLA
eukprot:INCI3303.1.p1 GENE.INCI3303.1~~INCI3303.1.p1  ORF type:complete len:118 (+),score=11.59 INCI3303.1:270-623(+)